MYRCVYRCIRKLILGAKLLDDTPSPVIELATWLRIRLSRAVFTICGSQRLSRDISCHKSRINIHTTHSMRYTSRRT